MGDGDYCTATGTKFEPFPAGDAVKDAVTDASKALPVLRNMLRVRNLIGGVEVADEMIERNKLAMRELYG